MVNDSEEEYVTYESYYSLNKHCTSQSCVLIESGCSSFYDLDSVTKRNSYSCLTEEIGLSTFNIFRALNRKGDEWPRAPSEPVHIVQDCITKVKPKVFDTGSNGEQDQLKKVKSIFLRECVLSSGICLKDCFDDSESSSHPNSPTDLQHAGKKRVEKYNPERQIDHIQYDSQKSNKKDGEKIVKDPCLCELDALGCSCKDKDIMTAEKTTMALGNQITNYREEVLTNMSNKHKLYIEKDDKLRRMSGDGIAEKRTANLLNDMSCILVMDAQDPAAKVSHIQPSGSRKSGVKIVKVVTNKIRLKPHKKSRPVRCPNCNEMIELTITEDEASIGVQPKSYRKSETAFTYIAPSKDKFHPKIDTPNECPHGCELVPLCQLLPKVNYNDSSIKPNNSKRSTPRFIRMTKACRHYPPCMVVPSCQRNTILKGICENIPPCSHQPRCANLPLCIPFCKHLHYDETTQNYVDDEEKPDTCYVQELKYIPLSQYKLLQHVSKNQTPNAYESRAYFVNQTHLPCQVVTRNAKQSVIATKSCQYDNTMKRTDMNKFNNTMNHDDEDSTRKVKEENVAKVDENNASVVYIRDVGCQFKKSSFSSRASYFQTRVCYTSSASFDPGSKRVDNLYTNPNAVTCEAVIIDAKKNCIVTTPSISSSGIDSISSELGFFGKEKSSKTRPDTNTAPQVATFCVLRNGEGGYVVPMKSKKSSLKIKCKNKFTVQHRHISQVLSGIRTGKFM